MVTQYIIILHSSVILCSLLLLFVSEYECFAFFLEFIPIYFQFFSKYDPLTLTRTDIILSTAEYC